MAGGTAILHMLVEFTPVIQLHLVPVQCEVLIALPLGPGEDCGHCRVVDT